MREAAVLIAAEHTHGRLQVGVEQIGLVRPAHVLELAPQQLSEHGAERLVLGVEAEQADADAARQRLPGRIARQEPHAELAPAVFDPEKTQVQAADAFRIDVARPIGERIPFGHVVEEHQRRTGRRRRRRASSSGTSLVVAC